MSKEDLIKLHGLLGDLEVHLGVHGAPEGHEILENIRAVEALVEKMV